MPPSNTVELHHRYPYRGGESVRLFENNTLERLSHAHPIIPLLVWSPVVILLLYSSYQTQPLGLPLLTGLALLALLAWTLTEYLLHRFLFHFPAKRQVTRNLVFTFHGVHHVTPRDKSRLVMPPTGALIFIGLFWLLFEAILPGAWLKPFFAFFITGYLIYDYIHYGIHHFPMKNPVARYLKQRHMQHHFKTPDRAFGVSSPLWDYLFNTR